MEHWTVREQLILGSAVQRSGDQNWVSVSRTIRPLSEENRQADFYSQKNCAMHYAALLDSASTPKRKKKRGSESETGETTQDLIVRELTEKRLAQITQLLDSISNEYCEVKKDLELIEKGELSDDEVTNMWNKLKDVDYNDISISQFATDDNKEENVRSEQKNDRLIDASDKTEPETVSNDKPLVSSKLVTASDSSRTLATPLIATPIITPVGNSATLIKIEPNVAMETLGGAKPVQVKVLSHDDHTYSSPGPPTLLTTPINSAEAKDHSGTVNEPTVSQASLNVDQISDGITSSNDTTADDQTVLSDEPSATVDHVTPNIDQTTFSIDHPTTSNVDLTSSVDQATSDVDQPTSSIDQTTPSIDQVTSGIDQATDVDQTTPSVDQTTPSIDQTTPSVDQTTPSVDQTTPSIDQTIPSVDQTTPAIDHVSTISKNDPSIDKDTTDQGTTALNEVADSIDQITPSIDHSVDQTTATVDDQRISTVNQASNVKSAKDVITTDQTAVVIDNQADSSVDQTTSVDHAADQESPNIDQSVPNNPTATDQTTSRVDNVATDSVNDQATPTTNQTTGSVDQITPAIDHVSPTADQTCAPSDQTAVTTEKKSKTRGSNRIASKMKMAQVGKVKTVRATSPRTMVIIGKQQSAAESDNEELQVHYKEPRRRLHRLMSNEPSESEEEPLSAVTSAMTSPSSSMMDDIDPEIAQSMKLWRKSVMLVWQHASQHKYASLFLHAVKDDEAAGYSEVVFRPMDLSLVKKKIETGVIRNDMEFQRDMLLMFQNALMYNSSNHDVYMMADEMRKDVMENIQDYLATQLMVHSNARTKILRSRDSRRVEQQWNLKDEELTTPLRKSRHRLPSDESISSISGAPLAKKMRSRTNED